MELEEHGLLHDLRFRIGIGVAEETNRETVFAAADFGIAVGRIVQPHADHLALGAHIHLLLVEPTFGRDLPRRRAFPGDPRRAGR